MSNFHDFVAFLLLSMKEDFSNWSFHTNTLVFFIKHTLHLPVPALFLHLLMLQIRLRIDKPWNFRNLKKHSRRGLVMIFPNRWLTATIPFSPRFLLPLNQIRFIYSPTNRLPTTFRLEYLHQNSSFPTINVSFKFTSCTTPQTFLCSTGCVGYYYDDLVYLKKMVLLTSVLRLLFKEFKYDNYSLKN